MVNGSAGRTLNFRQVDLELESGEYFLKSREKEARESERRKLKVVIFVTSFLLPFIVMLCCSKLKRQKNVAQNVPKLLSHLENKLQCQSTRGENERETRHMVNIQRLGRRKRKKKANRHR